jgi:uncharacterized protein YndB with AHSA1/START domain
VITDVRKDHEALTMTVTAEFDAPNERVWQLWADPRKLERWWGPPAYPATVLAHDLTPGGEVAYSMTGPEGDSHRGWWRVLDVDPPRRLEVEDGFADADGVPLEDMPTMTMRVELAERGDGGTRVVIVSTFASAEAFDQVLEMGVEQGMRESMGQMDAVLAEIPA